MSNNLFFPSIVFHGLAVPFYRLAPESRRAPGVQPTISFRGSVPPLRRPIRRCFSTASTPAVDEDELLYFSPIAAEKLVRESAGQLIPKLPAVPLFRLSDSRNPQSPLDPSMVLQEAHFSALRTLMPSQFSKVFALLEQPELGYNLLYVPQQYRSSQTPTYRFSSLVTFPFDSYRFSETQKQDVGYSVENYTIGDLATLNIHWGRVTKANAPFSHEISPSDMPQSLANLFQEICDSFAAAQTPQHFLSYLIARSVFSWCDDKKIEEVGLGGISFSVRIVDSATLFHNYLLEYENSANFSSQQRPFSLFLNLQEKQKIVLYDELLQRLPLEALWRLLLTSDAPEPLRSLMMDFLCLNAAPGQTSSLYKIINNLVLTILVPGSPYIYQALLSMNPSLLREANYFFYVFSLFLAQRGAVNPVFAGGGSGSPESVATWNDFTVADTPFFKKERLGLVADWLESRLHTYRQMLSSLTDEIPAGSPFQDINHWLNFPGEIGPQAPSFFTTHYPFFISRLKPLSPLARLGLRTKFTL